MTSTDPDQVTEPAQWQLQVQVTRTGPGDGDDPAQRWAAPITRAPDSPADLAWLLREAATGLDADQWADDVLGHPAPNLVLISRAEDIAAAGDLDGMRAVLRRLGDPHADAPSAAVVYAALLGRAQSVLGELAALTRRLAAVS